MKRILFFALTLTLVLCCLASCDDLSEQGQDREQEQEQEHEHILGAWEYDNKHHWRTITCPTNECDIPPNTELHLDEDEDLECDICGFTHTHTVGEWQANGTVHQKTVVCDIGICNVEPITEYHYNKNNEDICEACGAEHTHVASAWQYTSEVHWRTEKCSWEACDLDSLLQEHDIVSNGVDSYCTVCGYEYSSASETHVLSEKSGAAFLNSKNADDVAEIKIRSMGAGVGPGHFKYISYSQDKNVIARIFEEYRTLNMTPITRAQADIDGGTVIRVSFTFKDGSSNVININNGNFRDTNGNCYKLSSIPRFNDADGATELLEFITYSGSTSIYSGNESLGMIYVSELQFVEIDKDSVTDISEKYKIKTDFGALIFCTDEIFYIDGDAGTYYKLLGESISDYIAQVDEDIADIEKKPLLNVVS